jgi:hypothetical protein
MDNKTLLERAEEFVKRPHIRKRDNQFDKWKEVILYLKNKNIPTREILNFLFEEDSILAEKYKGRESTAYTLLTKYVKKHFASTKLKEDMKIVKTYPQKDVKNRIKKDSDLNESNEDKEKMIAHFGKDFVKTAGVEMAKVVYEMTKK